MRCCRRRRAAEEGEAEVLDADEAALVEEVAAAPGQRAEQR